jgi:ankyrin repeat protein
MRKLPFGLSTLPLAVALCAVPLLTALPASAQTASQASQSQSSQAAQTQAIEKYDQYKNSTGNQDTTLGNTTKEKKKAAAPTFTPTAPVGKADMTGNTPLHNAAYSGDTAKLSELLEKPGVEVDRPEKRGLTALMLASGNNHPDAVKLLLEKGANPNLKSREGSTALHRASAVGDLKTVDLLLKAGADPSVLDAKGRTPMQLADHYRQGDWSDVTSHLKAAQAAQANKS